MYVCLYLFAHVARVELIKSLKNLWMWYFLLYFVLHCNNNSSCGGWGASLYRKTSYCGICSQIATAQSLRHVLGLFYKMSYDCHIYVLNSVSQSLITASLL